MEGESYDQDVIVTYGAFDLPANELWFRRRWRTAKAIGPRELVCILSMNRSS